MQSFNVRPDRPPADEPAFNAPWQALTLALMIVGSYALQDLLLGGGGVVDFALSSGSVREGRWWTLFTALFLHGGWIHALFNAAFALAFGAPVARLLGAGPRGGAAFFVFFLLSGAFAGLGYLLVKGADAPYLIGASGAVSGLMGAAARTMDRGGALGPVLSPSVMSTGAGWIIVNLVVALVGFAPGLEGAGVAWQAHLIGFFAGVVLIGPVWALAAPQGASSKT
jgi:membrane associated rhomboid family serine protease